MIGMFIEIGGEKIAVTQGELLVLHEELGEYFAETEKAIEDLEELTEPDEVVYDSETYTSEV